MARASKWPSKWWFWGVPALANLYLLLTLAIPFAMAPLSARLRTYMWDVYDTLVLPAQLFGERVVEPVLEAWHMEYNIALTITVGLGLWELAAVVVGVAVYGGALLVHAIVGEPGREGEGPSHG